MAGGENDHNQQEEDYTPVEDHTEDTSGDGVAPRIVRPGIINYEAAYEAGFDSLAAFFNALGVREDVDASDPLWYGHWLVLVPHNAESEDGSWRVG